MGDQSVKSWTAEGILAFLNDHVADLQAMGVQQIGLFGSYARGEQAPGSDMDFLLDIENWTWKRWCKVWDFLEEGFGVKVDLVPADDLRSELRDTVQAEVRYAQIA